MKHFSLFTALFLSSFITSESYAQHFECKAAHDPNIIFDIELIIKPSVTNDFITLDHSIVYGILRSGTPRRTPSLFAMSCKKRYRHGAGFKDLMCTSEGDEYMNTVRFFYTNEEPSLRIFNSEYIDEYNCKEI